MGQQTRRRRQASIVMNTFSTKFVQPLGKGMIYREIILRFSGTLTHNAAAQNAAATLARGDEWSLIEKVDLIVNGTDLIRSFTGTQLRMMNRLLYGNVPRPSLTLGDGATAAPTFDSTCIIPLWMPLSVKPMDTALDSSKVSDIRLEITTAAATSVQSAITNPAIASQMDIFSYESFGVDGNFSDCRMYPLQAAAAGANANFLMQVPVGPVYRGFMINFADAATQIATDLATLTNVQVTSGTTVFTDLQWPVLRDWQRQRIGWGRDFTQGAASTAILSSASGTYLPVAKSSRCLEDAWGFLDFCNDGYMSEGIDTAGYSELNLFFNVPAAGTVTLIPIQIYPNRKAV